MSERHPDAHQLRNLLDEIRAIVDDFERGILDRSKPDGRRWSLTAEQLMARAKASPRGVTGGASGRTPRYASDGSRPGSTPALALSVSEERKVWDEWLIDVQVALTYLRHAIDIQAKATPAQQHPDRLEVGCRVCSRPGKPEPIYRAERCEWCYRFWLLWKADVPEAILRRRRQGQSITEQMIRAELDEAMSA